ncbi:MAG: AmmeMemoRadiSam system protein A [Deltaproteobacteria bacterium]|nr:AmmeMemoRadiSam system protein A [Deltaproteobacteria bacterium]
MIAVYPRLARAAVACALAGGSPPAPESLDPDPALWPRRACFVSLKNPALRGCIGAIYPTQPDLGREIIANALAAATRDPRFPPLTPAELPGVLFSVDVLGEPEPVWDWGELDPVRWGVIVSQGGRRGVLLPNLPGVDSVARQVAIAAGKAGISDLRNLTLQRFSVDRHAETEGP